jgi:hypothetical protein
LGCTIGGYVLELIEIELAAEDVIGAVKHRHV